MFFSNKPNDMPNQLYRLEQVSYVTKILGAVGGFVQLFCVRKLPSVSTVALGIAPIVLCSILVNKKRDQFLLKHRDWSTKKLVEALAIRNSRFTNLGAQSILNRIHKLGVGDTCANCRPCAHENFIVFSGAEISCKDCHNTGSEKSNAVLGLHPCQHSTQ